MTCSNDCKFKLITNIISYVISNKAWECWKEFVVQHKKETKVEQIAIDFCKFSIELIGLEFNKAPL